MSDYHSAIETYVLSCFGACTPPRVDELARHLHMHPAALSRRFRRATGRRLKAVLKERQIAEAKRLLASTCMTTRAVAHHAGFGTPNTLFRVFRHAVGITPEEWRSSADSPRE